MRWVIFLLAVSAMLATLSIGGIVITYLVLDLPQPVIVTNWGIGAIVIAWIGWAVGSFFVMLGLDD